MKNRENIILIGMSGAGKSTLGVLLAKALGKSFTDTDLQIQQREGRLLQDIIDGNGVDAFLKAEESAVLSVTDENSVIATGGSVVYSEAAMRHLCSKGTVVYLRVSFEELTERLSNITTRGIVFKNGSDLAGVYVERLPLYEKYADITVDCTGRSIEESVFEIIEKLR